MVHLGQVLSLLATVVAPLATANPSSYTWRTTRSMPPGSVATAAAGEEVILSQATTVDEPASIRGAYLIHLKDGAVGETI